MVDEKQLEQLRREVERLRELVKAYEAYLAKLEELKNTLLAEWKKKVEEQQRKLQQEYSSLAAEKRQLESKLSELRGRAQKIRGELLDLSRRLGKKIDIPPEPTVNLIKTPGQRPTFHHERRIGLPVVRAPPMR